MIVLWILLHLWLVAAVLVIMWCTACVVQDWRARRFRFQRDTDPITPDCTTTGVDVAFEPIGVCAYCDTPVLMLIGQATACCACGRCDLRPEFFQAGRRVAP